MEIDIAGFKKEYGNFVYKFSEYKKHREDPELLFIDSSTKKRPVAVVQQKGHEDEVIFDMKGELAGKEGYVTLWYMP